MAVKTDTLQIKFTTDGSGRVRAELNGVSQDIAKLDQAGATAASRLGSLKGALAGLVGAGVVQYVAQTTMEFQRLHAALVTVTGSVPAADREFAKLKQFAATTPYQLNEVVDAFIKLKARGLDPSIDTLRSFGNTAAATGKTLDQFIEAVADAATGQMERLKEFGITARQEGDKVAFTFQGVTTEVGRNADEITAYLQRIGDTTFGDGMARQADTLGGAMSNAKDAADTLAASIGDVLSPVLIALAGDFTKVAGEAGLLVRWFDRVTGSSSGLAESLGLSRRQMDSFTEGVEFAQSPTQKLAEIVRGLIAANQQSLETANANSYTSKIEEMTAALKKAWVAQGSLSEGTAKLVADLDKQAAAMGLSKSQVLELEKAQRLATTSSYAERAALTQAYDALIAKTKADEQATASTKKSGAATRDNAKALKEWNDQQKTFEGVIKANNDLLAEQDAKLDDWAASLQGLRAEYDPVVAATLEMEAAILRLGIALEQGMNPEDYAKAMAAVEQRYRDALAGINDANNDAIRQSAEDALTDVQRIWLDGAQTLGDGITEWIGNGFRGGADIAEDIVRDMLTNLARMLIQQKLVIPLQAQMLQGFGFSGGQIQQLLPGFMPQGVGGVGGPGTTGIINPLTGQYQQGSGQGGIGGFFSSMFGGGSGGGMGGLGSILGSLSMGAGIGGLVGGGSSGAMIGGALGSLIPGIGTIVGSILGGLLGGLIRSDDPRLEVSARSGNINAGRVEGQATSQLGSIFVGKDDLTLPGNLQSQELANRIAELDNALAGLLSPDELAAVKQRLATFDVDLRDGQATVENVLNARVNAIIGASEPMFATWLRGISDIEERIAKFAAIRELRTYINDFDTGVDMLANDGITKLRTQMRNLDEAVETTGAQLAEAIASKDVEAIAQAAEAAKQAVIRRYQAEIELAQQLGASIEDAERAARAFALNMAQRIAGVGGSQGDVLAVTAANVAATRGNVLNATDTQRALQHLDEFVASVDQWLQQSRAAVQAWYNEQAAALQSQLAALDSEQQGIYSAAQLRAEMEAQWAAQYQQQQQQAIEAQRRALEEQLRIANEWLGVLGTAESLIQSLTQSTANPMSGFGRMALLDADIARLREQFAANGDAGTAAELTQLLQQRLQLAGELFDRPSGEYLAIYNNTLRELGAIRDAARGPAEQVAALQEQLNALTAEGNAAFSGYASADLNYTAEEQARLQEIDAERERIAEAQRLLDEEAAARLKAIDDEARAHYEWAQTEGLRLQAEWRDEQIALLAELTGGRPIDEFIAQHQAESTELLGDIRDDIRAFLDLLAGNVVGGGVGNGGGGGAGPREPGDTVPRGGSVGAGSVTVPLDISFNVDGAKFGRYVAEVVIDKAGVVAPALKRQMRVA